MASATKNVTSFRSTTITVTVTTIQHPPTESESPFHTLQYFYFIANTKIIRCFIDVKIVICNMLALANQSGPAGMTDMDGILGQDRTSIFSLDGYL